MSVLSGLCSYDDVVSRMADVGLATASEEPGKSVDLINRKLTQAHEDFTLDLTAVVQKKLAPQQVDAYDHTPGEIVDRITDEGKAFCKKCVAVYTIRAMFEEGETRMRFKWVEAGDTISNVLKRWDALCTKEFDKIVPLLTFDQDGNGSITTIERLFMNTFSSVRVSV